MLTAIYVTNRDGEKALEILEQARKTIPDDYKLKIATVRILLAESRTDDAVQMAGQMAAEHATIDVVQQVYGVALFEDKQYDLALEFLKKANSMQPRQPETLTYKGRAEARLNQLAQAKKTFETLWEVSPGNLEAAQSIATIELRGNDTAAANKILKELRVLRPNDPRVDGIEADIRELRGDYKGAFELYQKVYEHNKNRETVMKLVNLAPRMGADGIQIVKDFLQENPDDEPARVLLAQLLQQKGRSSEAITEYETILAARPKDTLVLNNLAWLYFETSASGSGERALELSKLAHELNPGSAPIADTHGWILFRSGNVEKGKEVLALADQWAQEQGISVARDIAYHYAAALSESGDRAAARVRLNSILSDDTPFSSREEAQRLLDSLAAR